LGLRIVLIIHDQHARSPELARAENRHLLGPDPRVGPIVAFVALDGQGGGFGVPGLIDDDRDGVAGSGGRVAVVNVKLVDEENLLGDLPRVRFPAQIRQILVDPGSRLDQGGKEYGQYTEY